MGYADFTVVDNEYQLTEFINNQTVQAFISEITYEDYQLEISIEWKKVISMSGMSLKEMKSFAYGFLRGMEEMWVVIRDTFDL